MTLLLSAMLGCGSPTPQPLVELDEGEFNLQYSKAICRHRALCGILDDWGDGSEEECIDENIAWWELGREVVADRCPEATYSPTQAAACLDFAANSTQDCEWGTGVCADMEWYQNSCYAPIICYTTEEEWCR